jgi:hypothetical protein
LQIAGANGDRVFRGADKGLGHGKTQVVEQRMLPFSRYEDDDIGRDRYMGMMIGFCML